MGISADGGAGYSLAIPGLGFSHWGNGNEEREGEEFRSSERVREEKGRVTPVDF